MTLDTIEVAVGMLSAIPSGEGRTYSVQGENIAVFRTRRGEIFAVQASCPHRGGPLADGLIGGTTLICPLHSWKFDLATGSALFGDCGIKTFPVRVEEDGRIVVALERTA